MLVLCEPECQLSFGPGAIGSVRGVDLLRDIKFFRIGEDMESYDGFSCQGNQGLCSPAIAQGAIYVRSDGHLWKIAK